MHYLTDVDAMLFAYGHIEPGKPLDWRCFWEGRVSSKRALHLRHALHDQRLAYSIDVEMAWRLAPHGLEVFYEPKARSTMLRPIGFEEFRRRCQAKGRAQAAIARLHDEPELRQYLRLDGAAERWREAEAELDALCARIPELEAELANDVSADEAKAHELHRAYRAVFQADIAKGIIDGIGGRESRRRHAEHARRDGDSAVGRCAPRKRQRRGARHHSHDAGLEPRARARGNGGAGDRARLGGLPDADRGRGRRQRLA